MAEYRIDLGIGLQSNDFTSIQNKIKSLESDPIKLRIDSSDVTSEINDIKNELNNLGKTKGLKLDTSKLEASFTDVKGDITEIKNLLGSLGSGTNMKGLASSIGQIGIALDKVSGKFDELTTDLKTLSSKDFSVNIGLKLGGGSSPSNSAAYGDYVRQELYPELKRQEQAITKYLAQHYNTNEISAVDKLYKSSGRTGGFQNIWSMLDQLEAPIKKGEVLGDRISQYRNFFKDINEMARMQGIDLSPIMSQFDKLPDELIESANNIKNGTAQVKNNLEELKNVFGGNVDGEQLSIQLDSIVTDLNEIKIALQSLSSGTSLDGLTSSFERLSDSIEKLVQNATLAKNALDGGFDGVGKTIDGGSTEKAIQDQKELAQAISQTANEAKKLDSISIDISDGNIEDIKNALRSMKVDDTSIENATKELSEMNIVAKNVSAAFKDNQLVKVDIKGVETTIDGLERAITATTTFGEKTASTSIKCTQAFDKIANTAQKAKAELADKGANGLEYQLENIRKESERFVGESSELEAALKRVDVAFEALNTANEVDDIQALAKAYNELKAALESANSLLTKNKQIEKLELEKETFSKDIEIWLQRNTAAAKTFGDRIEIIQSQLKSCDKTQLDNLKKEFKGITQEAKLAGKTGQTFVNSLKSQFSKYSSYFSVATLFMYAEQGLRDMFEQVKLIDSAMTELKKVTDETDASYNRFLTNASSRAQEIGTTIDGLVSSTADFARLGYSFEDSQGLAEVANIYAVVGDEVEGVEGATESLISTMAAFKDQMNGMSNDDFAMSIIDVYNEIGNNFAISSGGLGEALKRSASSLAAANNTLHESASLITAANTVVQNPEKVGNAMKTISMRIRGAKTELEDMGESTDGMVESTATLRAEIQALSGVDIMASATEFKSTYQIMDELSQKWEGLSDIAQATIVELMAGKHQGNVFASLMENFQTARDALETSLDSSGSALQEHEKWQKSLEAQILKLKASWQGLSQAFMSSDFLHGALDAIIDLVSGITKLIDTIGVVPTLLAGVGLFKLGKKGLGSLFGVKTTDADLILKIADAMGLLGENAGKSSGVLGKVGNALKGVTGGATTAGGALKNIVKSLGGIITSHPYIAAAVVAVTALTAVFAYQKKQAEELAKKVDDVTSKYKEQHSELTKLKSNYDTSNESSMISKYEKLSKGVDGLGKNISLTSDEYLEYQDIVNKIAEQIPSLVTGYDAEGNALLSCKGNVEALTEAYQKLIHAQNQEILTNTGNIEKDFSNTLNVAEKGRWYKSLGGIGGGTTTSSMELLEKILNGGYSESEIKSLLKSADKATVDGIYESLKDAGIGDLGAVWSEREIAQTLSKELENNSIKIKGIIDDYYTQFTDDIDQQKTIAQAKLSEAFDISSAISGLDYSNISEELQDIAYQTVNSLDYDFFSKLSESGKSVEQWTTEMLNSLNALSSADNKKIETGFELQTKFNGGDISYGQYISQLQKTVDFIDKDLNIPDEVKNQIKLSLNSEDLLADYNALVHDLENIGFDDKSINKFLNSLSAEEYSAAMKIIPNLDAGATINEIQALIDEHLATEFTFDIAVQTEGIEAFNTALAESRSAAGLTSESISALKSRYEDLEGFNAAALFEKTSNGIHLNNDELSRLEEQYISINKLDIERNLSQLVTKYNDLTEEIKTCTDAQEKESLQLQADKYREKIDEISTLASQYDGLTSAFAQWQAALEGAEEGDNYDSLYDNLQNIKELYQKGLVGTDKFKTAAQLMTSKDLSDAGIDEIVSAYQKGYPKMQRYFTEGQKGCKNFLNDVQKLNSEWAHMNKDGSWEINFNVDEIAKGLNISTDAVLQIAKKLKDYGFEVNFEDSSIDSLQTKIEQTEAKLKKLGQAPVDINVDIEANSENIGTIETEIEKAKSKIAEINNSSVEPKVKTAQLEDAQAKLEALIDKKIEASQPSFMSLDTSQVNASLVEALEKVKTYQEAINEVNRLSELKEAGITIDDSQLQTAKEKVDDCAKAIQGLEGNVKVAIGLEEDGSIDSIKQAFEEGKIKIDADTDPAITKIELLAENVEKIEDKDVTINVTVNGLEDVKELNRNIDLATDIDGDIDKLSEFVEGAKQLSGLDSNITTYVTANIKGNVIETSEKDIDNLKVFAESIEGLEGVGTFKTDVTANINGNVKDTPEYAIDNLKTFSESAKNVESIGNVESTVTANIDGNVKDTPEYMINNLKEFSESAKDVYSIGNVESNVTANVSGNVKDLFEEQIDNLITYSDSAKEVGSIGDVSSRVEANIEGNVKGMLETSIDNLKVYSDSAKDIDSIGNVSSSVDANITGNVSGMLEKSIDNLAAYSESAKNVEDIGNVTSSVSANITGNVTGMLETSIDNLKAFSENAQNIDDVGEVKSSVDANIKGNVTQMLESSIDNLKAYSENAKDVDAIGDVKSTVDANITGNVKGMLEKSIDNLKVYSDSAKDIESIGNVESKVTADVEGNVIDTPEWSINNLKTFTDSAKDVDSIGEDIKAKVTADVEGNVIDTSESGINKLKTFVDSAQDVKNVGEDTKAKVTANVEGNVINTFEEKIDNLKTFVDSAKNIKSIDEDVKAKITADIEGNVKDTPEYMINNLSTFVESAKNIESVGEDVKSKITADIEGNVVNTFEGQINNLKTFIDSAKNIDDIGEDVKANVTANVNGNVINTSESSLDKLKVFTSSAKSIDKIGEDTKANVTANVNGNVLTTFEEQIDNLGVFADNANKLKDTGNFTSSVSANVSGNITTDDTVITDLEHFVSITNGLSESQTVSINVTANVDSADINSAITLLTNVASSGVFKDYKATVQVGATIATIDDAIVQNYKAPKKEGEVAYKVDSSIVDAWKAPSKSGTVNYSASVEALTNAQKYKTGTITYKANIIGLGGAAGTANVAGAAHADGSTGRAFARGNWGIKGNGVALGGELGRELVVRNGRFFTIGDEGAEFFRYRKNDIVFNAAQTESLFKYGGIKGAHPRGKMLASGTAFAEGLAFYPSSTVTGGGNFYGGNSSSKKKKTKTTKTSTNKNTVTGKDYNKSKDKSSTNDFEETFDWIEVKISRLERAIDRLDKKASGTWRSWSSRNKALTDELSKVGDEIDLQEKAYDKYIAAANATGLSSSWKKKVQNGTLDFSTVKDESLAEKIKDYQTYYEKALACKDAIADLRDTEAELAKQQFDNIAAKYDAKIDRLDAKKSIAEENITQSKYTTKSGTANTKNYKSLISLEEKTIANLKSQKKELENSLKKAIEDGTIKKYSEEWYTMQGTIDEVAVGIEQSTTKILESYEEMFDGIAEKYGATIDRLRGKQDIYQTRIDKAQYTTKATNYNGTNYRKIVAEEQKVYDELVQQKEKQQAALDDAVANGHKKGSQVWQNMQAEVNATTLAMEESALRASQAYGDMFDFIGGKYDGVLQGYDHTEAMLNEYIAQAEAQGHLVSTKYYDKLITNEESNIKTLKKQQADMVAIRDEALESGKIVKNSAEWLRMSAAIDEVTQEIEASETSIMEWNKSIRDLEWEAFDLAQERISKLNDEAEFFIELMSNKKLYDDNGQLTDEGKATMGMHAQNYNVEMRKADNYGAEAAKLNEEIAKDPYNQDLINRRDELLDLQRDSILAAESEKNAIRDLVEEGINLELDALQERIDKQNESLQSARDLYEYNKKVKDQTKEIANLEKQMAAYSGDDSEEARQKIQQIKVQLEEAKENLQETEMDKYISDSEKLLDNLYNEYETILNSRLDNIDGLVADAITAINDNSGVIAQTLYSSADQVGYTMSEEMNGIWAEAKQNADAENQRRVEQTQAIVNQLVANGTLTQEQANSILTALGNGDAQSAQETLALINQLVANGTLAQQDANSIITALSLGNQQQVADTLTMLQELVADGKMSQQDADTIINALVTGDAQDVANANNVVSQLVANGTLAKGDADRIIAAINGAQVKDNNVVAEYDKDFEKKDTTTNKAVNKVEQKVEQSTKAADTTANTEIKKNSTTTSAKKDPTKDHGTTSTIKKPTTTTTKKEDEKKKAEAEAKKKAEAEAKKKAEAEAKKKAEEEKKKKASGDGKAKVGDKVKFVSGKYYYSSDGQTPTGNKNLGKQVYITKINTASWATHPYHISTGKKLGSGDLGWLKLKQLSGYASGKQKISNSEYAWTQENGQEFIIRPSDGAILTPVAKGDSVLNTVASGNIWSMANNPAEFIKNNLGLDNANVPNGSNVQNNLTQHLENVTFSFPNVHSYDEMLKQMQKDKSFEKLIMAMTIDRVAGKSALAKGKAIR